MILYISDTFSQKKRYLPFLLMKNQILSLVSHITFLEGFRAYPSILECIYFTIKK